MQDSSAHSPPTASPADLAFVERWADYTKAYSIYPPTNARVRAALDAMREQLPKAMANRANAAAGLEIIFFHGGVQLGGKEGELRDGTNASWLHERIRKAGLAGVTILPDVQDDPLLAFTARLLELCNSQELPTEFDELWPDTYRGIQLHDLRFAGRFRKENEPEMPESRVAPQNTGADEVDTSGDQDLVELLMEDEEVKEALDSLQNRMSEETDHGETTYEVDVLGRLLQQMPPDTMDDKDTLLRVTRTALQALESRVGDYGDIQSLPDDVSLIQLMFEASQGILGRCGPTNEEVAVRLREHVGMDNSDLPDHQGHKGDEKITDDEALFWEDVGKLPPPWSKELTLADLESVPEEVGVFLHFFTCADQEDAAEVAKPLLENLLRNGGAPEAAVLLPYLRPPASGPDEAYRRRRGKVLGLLHDAQLAALLRECGLLSKDAIRDRFPRDFGLYLEALDTSKEADREELSRLVGELGPVKIAASADELVGVEGVTQEGRIDRILAVSTPSMMPLFRLLLARGDRTNRQPIVQALRRLRGDDSLACLLSIVDEPELLPVKYLQALTEGGQSASDAWAMRDLIAGVICRYLYATADKPEKTERRAYAIQCLEHFMTPDARDLLRDLLRSRKHLVIPSEPKQIRQAARRVLQTTKAH